MALARMDYTLLREKMADAVSKEIPQVGELRQEVRRLSLRRLDHRPCRAIAPMATDGGENRLTFEPLNLEIIRVVDSDGQELIQEVIAISEDDSVFREISDRLPAMRTLLDSLQIDFDDLSYLLGGKTSQDVQTTSDNRGRVRAFRGHSRVGGPARSRIERLADGRAPAARRSSPHQEHETSDVPEAGSGLPVSV